MTGYAFLATAVAAWRLASASTASSHELPWPNCLPGPLRHDTLASCVTASFAPWTHRPHCPDDDTPYCVHTNARFGRHGVSVIAVPPARANESTTLPAVEALFSSPSTRDFREEDKIADDHDPPYEIRDIPGKGKGLVATRAIPHGTVLMVDHAVVLADAAFPRRVRRDLGRDMLREAIGRLAPGGEEAVLALARSSADPGVVPAAEDVVKTNSFSVEVGGGNYMALFPRVAVSATRNLIHSRAYPVLTEIEDQPFLQADVRSPTPERRITD